MPRHTPHRRPLKQKKSVPSKASDFKLFRDAERYRDKSYCRSCSAPICLGAVRCGTCHAIEEVDKAGLKLKPYFVRLFAGTVLNALRRPDGDHQLALGMFDLVAEAAGRAVAAAQQPKTAEEGKPTG